MSNSSIQLVNRTLSDPTHWARMDLRAMAMKGYSQFPKAPALLKPHYQIFCVISGYSLGETYSSAEMELVYSAAPAPADWDTIP